MSCNDTLEKAKTVLLVDDGDGFLEFCRELLEELGYQVLTARNGSEAIQVYGNEFYHIESVLLLDLVLPDMACVEV